ncbi:hypothetical protein LL962_04735 [Xanthomonas sp. NCPPB 1067]|uniref:hypothetical protein n=1 Tax=Xanthomonas sp. NCPPB 1067 TaxID=487524 RepID=UPI001E3B2149|nr:hypothetical protein [Xanthomonas sp. NCPPB 1067]MCC4586420.1 hypothetical protein [Xanthomonas sp. NCPPB 1067]
MDLHVSINGSLPMAYVQGWSLYPGNRVALVLHFAFETYLLGKGFGEALARGYAKALRQEFGAEQIVFSERCYSVVHEKLFKRLDAQAKKRRNHPGCPDWVWKIPDASAACPLQMRPVARHLGPALYDLSSLNGMAVSTEKPLIPQSVSVVVEQHRFGFTGHVSACSDDFAFIVNNGQAGALAIHIHQQALV